MQDNTNGRRWAHTSLTLALGASMVGNVAHTVLADSSISLVLRVPGAIVWPLFTFLAIETLVRVIWERKGTHYFARTMLLFPAVPAAVVSYEHLFRLLLLMGETRFIAAVGPLAVDGLMIGCTLTVLFTRTLPAAPAPAVAVTTPATTAADVDVDRELEALLDSETAPVEPKARTPRGEVAPALKAAVEALLTGDAVLEGAGASRAVIGRYRKVLRELRENPHAVIDTAREKVRPELVDTMRAAMRLESVR